MNEYRCHQCETMYSYYEYKDLDRQLINPENEDQGYEKICECGSGFHTDKWQLLESVETEGRGYTISTVGLLIPHGLDHNQWYETLVSWESGDYVTDRYVSKDEAEDGHGSVVEALRDGRFGVKDTQYATLEIDQ